MITVKEYLIGIAAITVVYYGIVLLKYYNHNLMGLLKKKDPPEGEDQDREIIDPFEKMYPDFENGPDQQEDVNLVQGVIGQLKETIQDASENETSLPELKSTLSAILHLYPALSHGLTRVGINEEVVLECRKYKITAKITYSEVDAMWAR